MLANFFDKSKPINFIVILGLYLIYFLIAFFSRFSADVFTLDFFLQKLLEVGLCLILFFMFNFVLSKNKLTKDNSYAFLLLVVLFGSFSASFFDIKTLIVTIIFLLFLRKIYSLKTSKAVFEKLFDAGFWIGILFIIEPFFAVLGILLYIATFLFQRITFRTLLIPVLGFISPLLIYFAYCFWFNTTEDFNLLFEWYTNYNFDLYYNSKFLIPILFFTAIYLYALLAKTPKKVSVSGNERKNWIVLFFQVLVSLLIILLLKDRNGNEVLILFFPLAIVIANWLERLKSFLVKTIILTILTIFPIVLFII